MADNTGIQYADASWNPITGCNKVSPGCKNCFAEREWIRLSKNENTIYYRRKFTDVQFHPERLKQVFEWKRPRVIFTVTMGDPFHDAITDEQLGEFWGVMAAAHWHKFLVFTKRARRAMDWTRSEQTYRLVASHHDRWKHPDAPALFPAPPPWPLPNVALIFSAENQVEFDKRAPFLQKSVAAIKGYSLEPLIGFIDLRWEFTNGFKPHCVIIGGESGLPTQDIRPMEAHWPGEIVKVCREFGVRVWFKQWGDFAPNDEGDMERVGKKAAGNLINGQAFEESPFATR